MQEKDQCPLEAVQYSEYIGSNNCCGVLFKQESPKHPHQSQYAHLGYSCHRKSPAGGKCGWIREGSKKIARDRE